MANLDQPLVQALSMLSDLTSTLETITSAIGCEFLWASVDYVRCSMGLLQNPVLTPIL